MSLEFNSNSEEDRGNYFNLMAVDDDFKIRSKYGGGSHWSACVQWCKSWTGASAVCLGLLCLLLLAGIIGLVTHYAGVTGHCQAKYENLASQWNQSQSSYNNLTEKRDQLQTRHNSLTEERDQLQTRYNSLTEERDQLQTRYNSLTEARDQLQTRCNSLTEERDQLQTRYNSLTEKRDQLQTRYNSLTEERDQLKISSNNLAKEKEQLQSRYNTVAASRDELQEEVTRLSLNITEKPCRQGWTKFNGSCYYVSTGSKTWERSRQDCQERGADLVIVNTRAEQTFVTRFYDRTWIGLSDKHVEGKWKWVDGTDLVGKGFWQAGEPNDMGGKEDCVEVSRKLGWNDISCRETLSWVCEE